MATKEEFIPNSAQDYKVMESCWADLPEDLLSLTFSKLFTTKDRSTFRSVCRSWNSAAAASPDHPHLPCLVYSKRSRFWKFFQYNDSFYLRLSEFTNAVIRCSNFGWLLMHRDDRTLFFFDPFNNRRIEVPGRTKFSSHNAMHFFHPPTSPHCFIVRVIDGGALDYNEGHMWISILRHGSSEWESHDYPMKKPFWMSISTAVLRDGLLYFSNTKGDVAVFDVDKHKRVSALTFHTNCLRPRRLRERVVESFLLRIEDDGAIFAVIMTLEEAMVYKLLEPKMQWELVNGLGDKVLYVSRKSSFGVTAPVKSMVGNTINFAQVHGGSPIFYSLEDHKYHSFRAGKYLHGDIGVGFAAWISPSPRRRTDMVPQKWM